MDSILFERFLDNLELYLTVKETHADISRGLYENGKEYYEVEEATEGIQDTIDSQRFILQEIFESMIGDKNGDV